VPLVPDEQAIAAEQRLLTEPLYQKARPLVVKLVDRLQNASSPEDWFLLHRDLLVEFGGRQAAISDVFPPAKEEARETIAKLARQRPRPIADLNSGNRPNSSDG
jgi:hypothetical protein